MDKNGILHDKIRNCEIHEIPNIPEPEFCRQYGLWLFRSGSGCTSVDSFRKCKVRYFRFYSISHMYRGHGMLWLENGEREVRSGECVVITPGTRNRYGGFGDVYDEDSINFTGPVADMMMRAGIISNGVFPLGRVRRLLPIMELMRDPAFGSQLQANLELQKLLAEICLAKQAKNQMGHPLLEQLLIQLKETPRKWWTVSDMAEMCDLSVDQLRRIFYQRTGVNPKLYLDRLKLNQAAAMLVNTERNISEIAEYFGYMDQYHFSRRFKAVMGMSPVRYRESARMN